MSLHEAAKSGNRRRALEALRDRLATDMDDCQSKRDMAALALRLMDVLEQIDSLGAAESGHQSAKETGLSEFEQRLQAKQSAPKAARRAGAG